MDPNNYRGNALACCLSKFYAAILNRRLLNFAIEKNIIHKNQLGFMPKNRCSDATYSTNTVDREVDICLDAL